MQGTATQGTDSLPDNGISKFAARRQDWIGPHRDMRFLCIAVFIPLTLLVVLTVLFRLSQADLVICRLFFDANEMVWPYNQAEPWVTLYRYGPFPGLIMGISGAVLMMASYFWTALRPWRELGVFLVLLLALGPGLVINGVLKPTWSRPRPNQMAAFGGDYEYVRVGSFGPAGVSKSFPCGHAGIGFYLMAPAFVLYRRHRRWALAFLLLGLSGGGILGLARVVQGQHFPSDVLWSAGLVYLLGVVLSYLYHVTGSAAPQDHPGRVRPKILRMEQKADEERSSQDRQDGTRRRAA